MEQEDLFARYGLFDARVPRYTSYPPANRFAPLGPGDDLGQWCGKVEPAQSLSLYMHIPFCKRLCWFCACRTQGTKSQAPVRSYVSRLVTEMTMLAKILPPGSRMGQIHLGGGTPTILSPDTMDRLLQGLETWTLRDIDATFSVEIDPTDCDAARLQTLRAYGMNRASLGVQDFDPAVQAAIGREQSYEQTRDCVQMLRGLGIDSINLDIVYGLPKQTATTLDHTLDHVLSLAPDRIAAFGYAHVPWMSRRQVLIPEDTLPDPRQRLRLFERMRLRLRDAGYVQIGIDHFVKPMDGLARAHAEHRLKRNFQGYTEDNCDTLIGLGASAISSLPQGYLQNQASTAGYLGRIDQGIFATARGIRLTERDRLVRAMIESLMCYGRIDADRLGILGARSDGFVETTLHDLAAAFPEIVTLQGPRLHVAQKHFPLLRILAAALDEQAPKHGAHSVAV